MSGQSLTLPDAPRDDRAPGFPLGTVLGRYQLVHVLGAGGMGVVFEARDPALDRAIAVKVLAGRGDTPEGAAQLLREGVTMARLTHPNVIRVYDVGVAHDQVFIAMELVRGITLATWLERVRDHREIVAAFLEAGRGLAAAHDRGLVHRDFKPQNVLVGDDRRVLVTDFGLAMTLGDQERGMHGTPAFMAPERQLGAPVDARADQYSFCVALAGALAAEAPRGASTSITRPTCAIARRQALLAGLAPRVPRRIRRALRRGLAPDPARRFASMGELLARLEPPRPARRWPLVGATCIVLGAGAALLQARCAAGSSHARDEESWLARPSGRDAELLWARADRAAEQEDHEAEMLALRQHVAAAAAAHDDRMVARSWVRQILLCTEVGRVDEAIALLPAAEAAIARGGDGVSTRFWLAVTRARVAAARGDVPGAMRVLGDGRRALAAAGPGAVGLDAERITAMIEGGRLDALSGRWDEAAAAYWAAIAMIDARLGPDHPQRLDALLEVGAALRHSGDDAGALSAFREAGRLGAARLPASPRLAGRLDAVGSALVAMDHAGEAVPLLERARAAAIATLPPGDRRLASTAGDLGFALLRAGRPVEARAYLDEALALRDRPDVTGPAAVELATTLYDLAAVDRATGRCETAAPHLARALALFASTEGDDSGDVVDTLTLIADCAATIGRWRITAEATVRVLDMSSASSEARSVARALHRRASAWLARHAAR